MKSLTEIVKDIEALGEDISFEPEFAEFNFASIPLARQWMQTKYYRMLAATAKYVNAQHALEIGCYYGGGALALAKNAKRVTTYDVVYQLADPRIVARKPITLVIIGDNPDQCTKLDWSLYDLIFVDIGMHSGEYEAKIHTQLTNGWCGLAMYDDINWAAMRPFWDSIKEDKIETDWHPPTPNARPHEQDGFGIVRYGRIENV